MRPSFLDDMSWAMAEVYGAVTDRILVNLARYFPYRNNSPMDRDLFDYQARMLAQMGQVNRETAEIIAQSLGGADEALRQALEAAIIEALKGEESALRRAAKKGLLRGGGMLPPEVTPNQMQAFRAYYRQSADKLNLVNTVMLESTQAAYRATVQDAAARIGRTQSILNAGTGEVVTGVSAWNTAMHDAVAKMVDNGLTGFIDHAGRKWSPEAYAAMDIRTTMFNTARAAVWERNEAYGNDLYQVSSHNGARPLCYPWQGKVISRTDAARDVEDLYGETVHVYAQSETTYGQAGGLFGVNCKHYPMAFIPGFSTLKGKPQDPEENEKAYEQSQTQRALERRLRQEKREYEIMKAQGADEEALRVQRAKVNKAITDIDSFCDETGRARRRSREFTPTDATWPEAEQKRYPRGASSDVIDDYRNKATPGVGLFTIEPEYENKGPHDDEKEMAVFLHKHYGGDITLKAEQNRYRVGDPDYEWRGKLWDLKTPTSNKRLGDRVRSGLDQIKENTGGLIVDISKLSITDTEAWAQIDSRMKFSIKDTTDIILFKNGEVLGIKRYMK